MENEEKYITLSLVLLKRKFKAILLPNIYTATKKCLIPTRDTDLVLHRIQQYLGLKQYTIPVNNSTPERKRCDPLVGWGPQGSACVHLFLCHTSMCPVGFQSYLQTCEEDPTFQVCQENIPYCF